MMPMGAKNMQVDDSGGTFQQYHLLVDGMSYFAMPPMFELGKDRMWLKVERSRGGFGGGRTGNGNRGSSMIISSRSAHDPSIIIATSIGQRTIGEGPTHTIMRSLR